jgi:hypothetical protein
VPEALAEVVEESDFLHLEELERLEESDSSVNQTRCSITNYLQAMALQWHCLQNNGFKLTYNQPSHLRIQNLLGSLVSHWQ